MQLKIKRSQRVSQGLVAAKLLYVLDARAELTAEEMSAAERYGLMGQVIYNSKASEEAIAKSKAHLERNSWKGTFTSLAYTALAALNLNITIGGLIRGTHVECKDLDELLGAEEAIMEACKNLRAYLATAKTFDGREVIFDFTKEEPEVIAPGAVVKPPEIATPAPTPATPAPALASVPMSPALPAPPLSEPPALPPMPKGDIPPMPKETILPPLPAAAAVAPLSAAPPAPGPVPVATAPPAPVPVLEATALPPAPGGLPPIPPVGAPLVPEPAYAGPQLTRLSDGSYSAQPVQIPAEAADFLARAKESFGRLSPLQQGGVLLVGFVILLMLIKMF